jgi:tetratricopeptide (TPR) repeat protein
MLLLGSRRRLGALLATPLLDPAVQPLRRLADMSLPAAVDGCEELIAQLGYGYSAQPPGRLIPRLQDLATFTGAMAELASTRYAERLHSVIGWSSGLLANALYDEGDVAAASSTLRLALTYGQQTGDAGLVAYVRDRQAMFASDRKDYTSALAHIDLALREAPERTAIRTRLLAARARILARLHKQEAAIEALRVLRSAQDRLPATELGEGSFSVNAVTADGSASVVLLLLGDLDGAHAHAERVIAYNQALSSGPLARPTRLANIQLDLATVLLRQQRPDEGVHFARQALGSRRLVWGLRTKVGNFATELVDRYPELPEARNLHEEYQSLSV